jgi:hypothetical protein
MATKEFESLTLDGHNFPTWAMDLKVSLSLRRMYEAIAPPQQGVDPLAEPLKYNALFIIRNHIHPDLKAEYLMGKTHALCGLLFKHGMNSKRQSSCQKL